MLLASSAMILTSPRLVLRPLARPDLEPMRLMLNDWEVARWLARPPYPYLPQHAEEFRELVAAAHRGPHPLLFAIAEGASNRLIGTIGIEQEGGAGEIGYWIGRPYWGQGYAREAIACLSAEAERSQPGMALIAYVDRDNRRSQRVLEKSGFARAGTALRGGRSGPVPLLRFRRDAPANPPGPP